ncbi:hypothetical protein ACFXTH_008815 [Malus domestica]
MGNEKLKEAPQSAETPKPKPLFLFFFGSSLPSSLRRKRGSRCGRLWWMMGRTGVEGAVGRATLMVKVEETNLLMIWCMAGTEEGY